MFKGVLHAHSNYSDGEFTLPELRNIFMAEGCSFLCITDHAEYFDPESIQSYVHECESLSDEKFRIVPGLEYRCEREMHILGYCATRLNDSTNPEQIIRHIDSQQAISVIAHPRNDFFDWIETFQALPQGIETWNSKYDGRYAPRPGTFALLQRLKKRAPGMHAFYGQDLHWKHQFRGLYVMLDCDSLRVDAIRNALAAGAYSGQKDELQLPSDGMLPPELLAEFGRVQARSRSLWSFLKNGKRQLDRLGIRVPDSVKAQLRRIF
ncbi:MAG TPA: PHP domain-containing protein [Candidatus Sulfotelmatobacter sp.]|nr:PHP domain-containing protein [Candidatus Sulfotelmatobacter sp.]